MEGISLFLCENVILRSNGTFDIWAPWVTFFRLTLPLDLRICVFAHVAFDEDEGGDHVAKLYLVEPDKKETLLSHSSIVVPQERFDWRSPFVVNVKIEKTGLHHLMLKVDKKKRIETPFWILPQKQSNRPVAGFQTGTSIIPPNTPQ